MANAFTDAAKDRMLDSTFGSPAWPPSHVSLHTAYPGNTGTNEATGGSPAYARKVTAWAAASGGSKAGSNTPVFDVPAGTYSWLGYWSAITAGTYFCCSPLGAAARRAFDVTAAGVTANDIDSPAHGFVANDAVVLWAGLGAALPAGITEGTTYFVIATGLTTDVFRISTTLGGGALDITGIGDGDVQKIVAETFAAQGTYTLTAYTLSLPG